ncbi:MAG: HemK2/MTQ2 family protein methyltransferase [Nanoarchaeota archaeon]
MPNIYQPAEDSFLLAEVLKKKLPLLVKKNLDLKFLEIGCGSGVLLQETLKLGVKKENIFSCDINPDAVAHCIDLGFSCIQSDLFDKIPAQKYDIIVFNPPYLPEDEREPEDSKRATTGGKKGNEIILRFLEEAKKYLKKEGRIFLITSSLAEDVDFESLGYFAREVSSKKMFFEKITAWEVRR